METKNKPFIDIDNCVGCSLCIENCIQDCLELSKPKFHGDIHIFAYLSKPNKCLSCGLCAKVCPIKVITMSNSNTKLSNK